MSRILCIDYGKKRCGLAVTDILRIIASPLDHIETPFLQDYLNKYILNEKVEELLIGYPVHHDGTKTYLCNEIDSFLEIFTKQHPTIKIIKTDESYSSVDAKNLLAEATKKNKKRKNKGEIDKMSAVVILRRYLNY